MNAQLTYAVDAAVATATPKAPGSNQDRAGVFRTPAGAGVVLCDGVGAYADSGVVAERCLALATDHITSEGVGAGLLACPRAVAAAMALDEPGVEGATTLLAVGAEADGRFSFTMVGNGAIVAIEPFLGSAETTRLGFVELVLPQVGYSHGQAALRSFLPAPSPALEETSGILLPQHGRARLLLGCTDGVTTAEDRQLGCVPSGAVWQPLLAPFVELLNGLTGVWDEAVAGECAGLLLTEALQASLNRALDGGLLEDDATAGVVLVRPKLEVAP